MKKDSLLKVSISLWTVIDRKSFKLIDTYSDDYFNPVDFPG